MLIALKKQDEILVGLNDGSFLEKTSDRDLVNKENISFWKVKGEKDLYVGGNPLCIGVEIFRYSNIFKGIVDFKSIVQNVVPKMKEMLVNYGFSKDNMWTGQLVIIKGDRLYGIDNYFVVSEQDRFCFSKDAHLIGALESLKDSTAEESILQAYRHIEVAKNIRIFPIRIFNPKTNKSKVYYR